MLDIINKESEFMHHGVKGMKWGVRKDYNRRTNNYNRRTNNYNRRTNNYNRRTNNYNRRTNNYNRRTNNYNRRTNNYNIRTNNYNRRTNNYNRRTNNRQINNNKETKITPLKYIKNLAVRVGDRLLFNTIFSLSSYGVKNAFSNIVGTKTTNDIFRKNVTRSK